jgi:hypothetical protein
MEATERQSSTTGTESTTDTDSTTTTEAERPQTPRVAPRDIVGDVTETNIVEGPRVRRASEKVRKQAYFADLERPSELPGFHGAFAAGQRHRSDRPHRDQLPEPPRNWKALKTHPHGEGFRAAAIKEYRDLDRRGTFRYVPTPSTTQILPLVWIFTYKFDTDGYLAKYKARLCVRGDLQPPNNQDNYAATLAVRSFRAMMAIAAAFDLEAHQLDAVNAFTNSRLDETVHCEYPEGFKQSGRCLLLRRALYGLRRSPLLWYKELSATLTSLGLLAAGEDMCLFASPELICSSTWTTSLFSVNGLTFLS